jgi:hypothetical protein
MEIGNFSFLSADIASASLLLAAPFSLGWRCLLLNGCVSQDIPAMQVSNQQPAFRAQGTVSRIRYKAYLPPSYGVKLRRAGCVVSWRTSRGGRGGGSSGHVRHRI